MRNKCLIFLCCLLASCNPDSKKEQMQGDFPVRGRWIDLSYDFSSETLYWPAAAEGFRLDTVEVGFTGRDYFYAAFSFCAPEHGGTHFDAPLHFAEGKHSVEQVPLAQLTGPTVVIDVSDKALQDRDYQLTTAELQAWEEKVGQLPENMILLIRTGFGRFYPDGEKYFGTNLKGKEGVDNLHFPGLEPEAAAWLVRERKIKAVGIDTPSIDYGQSKDFRAHQELMKEDIPAFENVANLEKLPLTGAYLIALPMKIKGGSGAPLRIIARVPQN